MCWWDKTIHWCRKETEKLFKIGLFFRVIDTYPARAMKSRLKMFSIEIFLCKFKIFLKIEIIIDFKPIRAKICP